MTGSDVPLTDASCIDNLQLADRDRAFMPMYSNRLNLKAILGCQGHMAQGRTTTELSEKNHYLRG